MGEVIPLSFDSFQPRRFAKSKDEEIAVYGDIQLLWQVESLMHQMRYKVEQAARPMHPKDRVKVMDALAILKDQPRNG